MKKILRAMIDHALLVNVIVVAVMIGGVYFMMTLRQEAFPAVELDVVVIDSLYPQASALEIEKTITIPIENALKTIPGIIKYYSLSRQGFSRIYIELDPDGKASAETVQRIQRDIDALPERPQGALRPRVQRVGSRLIHPALAVHISSARPEADLNRIADDLERVVSNVEGVSGIQREGYFKDEIKVVLDPVRLAKHEIPVAAVVSLIKANFLSYPCGAVKEDQQTMMVVLDNGLRTAREVGEILIDVTRSRGARLKDVADIRLGREETAHIFRTDGRKSINLRVLKSAAGDNVRISRQVRAICQAYTAGPGKKPDDLRLEIVNDLAAEIKERLLIAKKNALIGLILVVLSLFILLDWRSALLTGAGLPVAFGLLFIVMGLTGTSVNLVSMIGMIIVLGMLVDDAIIVSENIFRHREKGAASIEAVLRGTSEVCVPVTGTVVTTMAAFATLFFIKGILGKFIVFLPVVVIAALGASLFEALFILPVHSHDLFRYARGNIEATVRKSARFFVWLKEQYGRMLERLIAFRFAIVGLALVLLVIIFGISLRLTDRYQVFGTEGADVLYLKFALPLGTAKETTLKKAQRIEEIIVDTVSPKNLRHHTTKIGDNAADVKDIGDSGEEYGVIIIYLSDAAHRAETAEDIGKVLAGALAVLKKQKEIASFRIECRDPGPYQGSAVAVEIIGEDYDRTGAFAGDVIAWLRKEAGIMDVRSSYKNKAVELQIDIDEQKSVRKRVEGEEIALTIRAALAGIVSCQLKDGSTMLDIRVQYSEDSDWDPARIRNLRILNSKGNMIPLTDIAEVKTREVMKSITHRNGQRYISIRGDLDRGLTSSLVVREKLENRFMNYADTYPGCRLSFSGEMEKTNESLKQIAKASCLALIFILIVLIAVFNTLYHPILVLLAVLFGFGGAGLALIIHGHGLTFVALVGIIGMTGVVVNDAIVLVYTIKSLRRKGMAVRPAVMEGAKLRLRPVLITSVTTLLGLAPTAYNNAIGIIVGGHDPFLPVIALTIGWGLLFATIVTLILIPCLYVIGDDIASLFRRRREGREKSESAG